MSLLAVVFLFLLHGLSSSGSYLLFGNKDEAFFYTTDASTYTPTPIPLSDVIPEPNEKPLIEITTPIMKRMGNISEPFEPQNHVQLPFNMPDTLDTQPSVAKSVFIPSQLENGFKPMLGQPRENYYNYHKDITNSRYDDGSGYHDKITDRKSSYHPWYSTKYNPSHIPHSCSWEPVPGGVEVHQDNIQIRFTSYTWEVCSTHSYAHHTAYTSRLRVPLCLGCFTFPPSLIDWDLISL